ncbi:MAG TPA: PH domain-containing protein [Micromonosporaceae bacterium]
MGFPESVLTSDERVVLHLHPHWKALVRPIAVLVLAIAVVVAAWVFLPDRGWSNVAVLVVAALALIAVAWLSFWPWLKWRTTHYVFTNERVIMREGVFSREGRDIPLNRVNDVSFHHSFFERLLGCGTLTIESAGERGQVVLSDIPHVEKVQSELYELTEAEREKHEFDDADRDAIVREVAKSREKD